jgi:hypothetical protein
MMSPTQIPIGKIAGIQTAALAISLRQTRADIGPSRTIMGERKFEKEEENRTCHRVERACGSVGRSWALPDDASPAQVSAEFKGGMITVQLLKNKKTQGGGHSEAELRAWLTVTLAAAALLVISAAPQPGSMGCTRVRRWLRNGRDFMVRAHPLSGSNAR